MVEHLLLAFRVQDAETIGSASTRLREWAGEYPSVWEKAMREKCVFWSELRWTGRGEAWGDKASLVEVSIARPLPRHASQGRLSPSFPFPSCFPSPPSRSHTHAVYPSRPLPSAPRDVILTFICSPYWERSLRSPQGHARRTAHGVRGATCRPTRVNSLSMAVWGGIQVSSGRSTSGSALRRALAFDKCITPFPIPVHPSPFKPR